MYIHARVKGPKGSISLRPQSFSGREPSPKKLKEVDQKARDLYTEVHGSLPSEITVDLKVSRNS